MAPATADVRELRGMVAKPEEPVTVADMNRAIVIEGGRVNGAVERPPIMANDTTGYKDS